MLSPEQVQEIARQIAAQPLNETRVAAVRHDFPGIHFTYCMDDDIVYGDPALAGPGFNLYLIDGREHCLRITANYQHATGIVIAEVIDD